MDIMLDNISKVLIETHSVTFNLIYHHVHCFAHVINLSARKLIDSLYITVQYEDESSFEEIEDTEDNLLDAIYKVIILQRKHY